MIKIINSEDFQLEKQRIFYYSTFVKMIFTSEEMRNVVFFFKYCNKKIFSRALTSTFVLSNVLDNLNITFSPKVKNEYDADVYEFEVPGR